MSLRASGGPAALSVSVLSGVGEVKTEFFGPYSGSKVSRTIIFVSHVFLKLFGIVGRGVLVTSKLCGLFSALLVICLSIIVRDVSGIYLWRQTPFIVGAVGPVCLDIFLMVQMCLFRNVSDRSDEVNAAEESVKASSSSQNLFCFQSLLNLCIEGSFRS